VEHPFHYFGENLVGQLFAEEEIFGVDFEALVEKGVVFPDFKFDVLGKHPVGYPELVLLFFQLQDMLLDVCLLVV